jgi:GH24 family phage-related lysozyme (muramidase)
MNPISVSSNDRERARRNAHNHFAIQEERSTLVRRIVADEYAAAAEKTARLRAMRLAKERELQANVAPETRSV